jgi:aryl-alcohol dehydrogenase-like predicted oxidoreductase
MLLPAFAETRPSPVSNPPLIGTSQMKLAIGTAQFGSSYGVANSTGQVSLPEVEAILRCAKSAGISMLDTAVAYGNSEQRLGEVGVDQLDVVTKIPPLPEGTPEPDKWVERQVRDSCKRLKTLRLYAVLLHQPLQLLGPDGGAILSGLSRVKAEGLVEKIGVSIYSPDELDLIHPLLRPELVQSPFSVLDRRLEKSGWLRRLSSDGVEVHSRSVFLQGLLVMPRERIPAKFARWQRIWDEWHAWLRDSKLSPQAACLAFANSVTEIHRVVVGVDSLSHLQDLVAVTNVRLPDDLPRVQSEDEELINPSLWHKL